MGLGVSKKPSVGPRITNEQGEKELNVSKVPGGGRRVTNEI